jgi:hypothetical protein
VAFPVGCRQAESVDVGRQIYLTFTRAQAPAAPGITHNVYLGLPAGSQPQGTSDPHHVGTLNFSTRHPAGRSTCH